MTEVIMLDTVALAQNIFRSGNQAEDIFRLANIQSVSQPITNKAGSTYFIIPDNY